MRRSPIWLLLALIPVAFFAGYRIGPDSGAKGEREVLYYVDPMNPSFHSPEPGVAPCGMALEPVYADQGAEAGAPLPPGAVSVRTDRQQLIGVTLEKVAARSLKHMLRLVGRVAADETREYAITAVTRGWVRELKAPTTGSLVKKSEILGAYYAPDVYTPQYTYVHTYETYERLKETGFNRADNMQGGGQLSAYERNLVLAEQTLLNLGMTREQMEEVRKSREVAPLVQLRAPAEGFILSRNIVVGQWFNVGDTIYRIVDLSHVWILADAFEGDEQFLPPGTVAAANVSGTAHTFSARVSEVLPLFDGSTRTLKVRLEADNPGYLLRPDMFVDVELPVELGPAIAVPEGAVLDTGKRQVVFVESGEGIFEPRKVRTGWRYGGKVEILSGLMEGEKVVTSGNFLLDSESRMRLASLDIRGTPGQCIVCDMEIDEDLARAAGRSRTFEGRTYLFCSERCLHEFDEDPAGHVRGKSARGGEEQAATPMPAGHSMDKTPAAMGSKEMPDGGGGPAMSSKPSMKGMPAGHSMGSMPGMAAGTGKTEDVGTAR
jgi:RND family efflux transporter MFP subunit